MKLFKKIYYYFFTKKIIKENIDYKRCKFEDRNVLEEIIFPHALTYIDPKTILDIGREDYQAFYNAFFENRELWTLDYDPKHAEFGAEGGRHITDNVLNIKKYFNDNYFDLIIINGVLGWGLDKKKEVEKTFADISAILKPGGLLVIGWNDFEDKKVIKPTMIESLSTLIPYKIKPLKGSEFKCVNGEHTYNFYTKK
jgi:SAM-dependent methyltransferase